MNFENDNQPETTRLQDHRTTGLRTTEPEPRFTFHASRFNAPTLQRSNASRAFTLIELLIVISIIAILAALTLPITGAVNRAKIRSRAKGELALLQNAIEAYKAKYGVYPPDNPGMSGGPAVNQLYYELVGTTNNNLGNFTTIDGSTSIARGSFPAAFGAGTTIGGFVNCSTGGGGDETKAAKDFLPNLKPGQYQAIPSSSPICTVLGCSLDGPALPGITGKFSPWRYVSSNPTNNPSSYDLWIDVLVGGKTNRICNWSSEPLIVDN